MKIKYENLFSVYYVYCGTKWLKPQPHQVSMIILFKVKAGLCIVVSCFTLTTV